MREQGNDPIARVDAAFPAGGCADEQRLSTGPGSLLGWGGRYFGPSLSVLGQ
jgi:hypothetical protein